MLNYRTEGAGPPLLMVHGFGVTFSIWEELAPLLRPYAQLILPELPGLGASPPPAPGAPYYSACAHALRELREQLQLAQWAVLGYSSGARAVEAYLQLDAPHVSRAAFLCPAFTPGWRALHLRALLALDGRWPAFGDWALSGWRLMALIRALGFNGRNPPLARAWQNSISAQPLPALKATLHQLPRAGATPLLLPPVPALFIWGTRDAVAARPRRPGPHDHFITANHSAPLAAAPAIAEILLPFLQTP